MEPRDVTVAIGPLALDCGVSLDAVEQHVVLYGDPVQQPVVLVVHGLTADARIDTWWSGVLGADRMLDPERNCIIGINALGSCYGSTGPASLAPDGAAYGDRFPRVTVSDMVRAQRAALHALGITQLSAVIGPSLGGMQALEWVHAYPADIDAAIVIAAHDHFAAIGVGINAIGRHAIAAAGPVAGLSIARQIAMLSYKSETYLAESFGQRPDRYGKPGLDIEGYLAYQGRALVERMDSATYVTLTHAMDAFDVRGAIDRDPKPPITFVGIASDWLFPPAYLRAAAERYARRGHATRYVELPSDHGHDAFLVDAAMLNTLVGQRERAPA